MSAHITSHVTLFCCQKSAKNKVFVMLIELSEKPEKKPTMESFSQYVAAFF